MKAMAHRGDSVVRGDAVGVVVIDDHELVRLGVQEILRGTAHTVVGEASNAADALAVCSSLAPRVVLLDIRFDQQASGSSFELIGQIRQISPHTRVIVFSAYDHPGYVARAMASGAHDYLLKGASADEVIRAIEAAAAGQPSERASGLRRVVGMMANRAEVENGDCPLTPRETQVLKEIALGLSNKEIAEALSISVETVKEHVQNLLRKLAVNDRTQAAVWAIRQGIA